MKKLILFSPVLKMEKYWVQSFLESPCNKVAGLQATQIWFSDVFSWYRNRMLV